ncbi:MAG: ATP-dependent protease, partial [Clostridiales bacterium]|nr:ATP-dependent protease [Clostridiales bacterium]
LSEVPIKQYIAVTGSVNQKGEIQPIGGVNEKIEGFYKVCKIKGLNGKHGVIIPHQNVKNLMLNDEVIEAVKEGKFTIYAVKNVDEGVEILTGIPAGTIGDNDKYPKGSIHALVDEKLRKYANDAPKITRKKKTETK